MTSANIIAGLLFGSIGFVAFIYGKKQAQMKTLLLGVALMGYTYFISNTVVVYVVGVALTAALFIFRD